MNTGKKKIVDAISKYDSGYIQDDDERLSYCEFKDSIASWKSIIQSITKGNLQSCVIISKNSLRMLEMILALEALDASVMLLSPDLIVSEYESCIDTVEADFVVTAYSDAVAQALGCQYEPVYKYKGLDFWRRVTDKSHKIALKKGSIIKITSGSEGKSKIVERTHESIIKEIEATYEYFHSSEIFLCIPQIFHSFGLVAGCLLPIYYGKTLILCRDFFPDSVVKMIENYKVDTLFAVPYMYDLMNKRTVMADERLASLRMCVSAGAKLRTDTIRKFYDNSKVWLVNDYGSTETGVMCMNTYMDLKNDFVGCPVAGGKVYVDTGAGTEEEEITQEGELIYAGAWLEFRYLGKNAAEGYCKVYRTGDFGRIAEHGFVEVICRMDDILNICGEKVSAVEVANVIKSYPGVNDCLVTEDKKSKGKLIAYIQADNCMDKFLIVQHCSKYLSRYKIPHKIEFMEKIPRNANGKLQKKYMNL